MVREVALEAMVLIFFWDFFYMISIFRQGLGNSNGFIAMPFYDETERPPLPQLPLIKLHIIPARILILGHLEVFRREAKRLQDAVTQFLEFAHHIGHFGFFRGCDARGEGAESGLGDLAVGGGEGGEAI